LLTFFTERLPAHEESLVYVRSSKGGNDTALVAAFNSPEAAQELATFFNVLAELHTSLADRIAGAIQPLDQQ
jgi:hypothetical protein